MICSVFILNWKTPQEHPKSKTIEAFRCRAAIQSQVNGLVTHSTKVSIRIAFSLSKMVPTPLSWIRFTYLGLSPTILSLWKQDCHRH